ncbi:hypothetical protein D3C76_1420920 [compost metagenome]
MDQYFLFEVLRKGAGTTHLHATEAVAMPGFQVNREQLQARNPTIGQVVQDLGIVVADFAELPQVAPRLFNGETQVLQVIFGQLALRTQTSQRQRGR